MGISVCPSAVVEAPVERVWALLTSPEGFDTWVDGTLRSSEPVGSTRPGQRLRFETSAFGRRLPVTIDVLDVDPEKRLLHLLVELPFGLVNDETLTVTPVGEGRALVRFG